FSAVQSLPLTDPKLLEYLQREILVPPSKLPYALTEGSVKWPSLFTKQLKQIFGNKTDRFFIECGANDGEFISNTLHLEKKGWKGLLIEAQPELGQKLRSKNRKAWFANVCLSPYLNISEVIQLEVTHLPEGANAVKTFLEAKETTFIVLFSSALKVKWPGKKRSILMAN
ncbi:unnamed protein product, partial [Allacma fusca]